MERSMLWQGLLGAGVALGALGWCGSQLLGGAGVSDGRQQPAEVRERADGARAVTMAAPSASTARGVASATELHQEGQSATGPDGLERAPDLASSLAALSEAVPELEPQLTRYKQAVLQARERTADYERRIQAQQRAITEGRAVPAEEEALAQEREQLLARARELGREAFALNEEIRSAAGMSHD